MAGLWSHGLHQARASLRHASGWVALVLLLLTADCSELAQPSEAAPPSAQPPYVSLAASHLQSVLKDRASYDGFEISGLRWVDSIKGRSWLTCVHFKDHGHLRTYAIFIQNGAVIDARFAVETDACEGQTYTQFDLVTGTLGRPTAPVQPALY